MTEEQIPHNPEEETIDGNPNLLGTERFGVGIVGNNSTAKMLKYAFTKPRNDIFIADGIEKSVDDLIEWGPNITFICTEVTVLEDGIIDAAQLEADVIKVLANTTSGVVIKTNLPVDLIDRLARRNARIVYNPNVTSFETDTIEERMNMPFHILGGVPNSTMAVQEIYYRFSTVNISNSAHVSPVEAALLEQSIASMIQMKQVFYNQLYDVMEKYGGDYYTVANYIQADPRVGAGGHRIPTARYNRGCDRSGINEAVKMLTKFNSGFTLMKECDKINDEYLSKKESQ